jgi:hypothetical protein
LRPPARRRAHHLRIQADHFSRTCLHYLGSCYC